MLAVLWIEEYCMHAFGIKVVVRMNISNVEILECHLISQLLTVTLPHPLYLLPDFFVCHFCSLMSVLDDGTYG